jgi:hypothetical protein
MATVHGMNLEERLTNIGRLYEIGYRHFSLGGLAARASQKKILLESVSALVNKIRQFYLKLGCMYWAFHLQIMQLPGQKLE